MKKLILTVGILSSVSMFFWIMFFTGLILNNVAEAHRTDYYDESFRMKMQNEMDAGVIMMGLSGSLLLCLWIALLVISIIILSKQKPAAVGLTIATGVLGIMTNIIVPPIATIIVSFITVKKYSYY